MRVNKCSLKYGTHLHMACPFHHIECGFRNEKMEQRIVGSRNRSPQARLLWPLRFIGGEVLSLREKVRRIRHRPSRATCRRRCRDFVRTSKMHVGPVCDVSFLEFVDYGGPEPLLAFPSPSFGGRVPLEYNPDPNRRLSRRVQLRLELQLLHMRVPQLPLDFLQHFPVNERNHDVPILQELALSVCRTLTPFWALNAERKFDPIQAC